MAEPVAHDRGPVMITVDLPHPAGGPPRLPDGARAAVRGAPPRRRLRLGRVRGRGRSRSGSSSGSSSSPGPSTCASTSASRRPTPTSRPRPAASIKEPSRLSCNTSWRSADPAGTRIEISAKSDCAARSATHRPSRYPPRRLPGRRGALGLPRPADGIGRGGNTHPSTRKTSNGHDHDEGRNQDFLQGLGHRAADPVLARMAAVGGCLGRPDAVLRPAGLPRRRP